MGNSFSSLEGLRDQLKEKKLLEEEEKKRRDALEAKRKREASVFSSAMSDMGVKPIRKSQRANTGKPAPKPVPRQSMADRKAVLRESVTNDVDPLIFLQSEDGRCFWREGESPDLCRKLRCRDFAAQDRIDLHGMTEEAAWPFVSGFIKTARKDGKRCVLIIHGKGNGSLNHQPILKEMVRKMLTHCGGVRAFAEPLEIDGGAGAVIVLLDARKAARQNPRDGRQ